MPKKGYKSFNFSLNPEIHEDFKHECYMQSMDMSEIIEKFIVRFNETSKKVRAKNQLIKKG